ncbi:hypothetical protein M8J77_000639 [Diaphorina citri]|nr:hypothetical protein M8J77_000639 [Diaphorina citri]
MKKKEEEEQEEVEVKKKKMNDHKQLILFLTSILNKNTVWFRNRSHGLVVTALDLHAADPGSIAIPGGVKKFVSCK